MPGRSFAIELTDEDARRLEALAVHLAMTPDELLADIARVGIDLREQERAMDGRAFRGSDGRVIAWPWEEQTMPHRVARPVLVILAALAWTSGRAVAAEQWQAISNTAASVTGAVTFSPDRITFQSGKFLPLAPAGNVPVNDVNGRRISATLFRVTQPDDPILQNGNRLCGGRTPMPVTYIAVWHHTPFGGDTNPRDLAVFSGPTPPATADRSCATYSYDTASAGAAAAGSAARIECPASLGGHKVLNWDIFEGSRRLPQQLAGDGTANVVWTITPTQAAHGVRVVCGYRDTSQVKEFALAPNLRRCLNREESRAFECN